MLDKHNDESALATGKNYKWCQNFRGYMSTNDAELSRGPVENIIER